jgi:hypothetical protein
MSALGEVLFCAIVSTQPAGCLPDNLPAAQLTQAPCSAEEAASSTVTWKHAKWGQRTACWRRHPQGDVAIVVTGTSLVGVPGQGALEQCKVVRCDPQQTVQTGPQKGKLILP